MLQKLQDEAKSKFGCPDLSNVPSSQYGTLPVDKLSFGKNQIYG